MEESVVLQRIEKVRAQMREQKVDAFFVAKQEESTAIDVVYLSGFAGSQAVMIVTQEKAVLIVDLRYIDQAEKEIRGVDVVTYTSLQHFLKEVIPEALGDAKRVGLMKSQLVPFGEYLEIQKGFPRIEFVCVPDIARTGRVVKDEEEIGKIKRSVRATEMGLRHAYSVIQPGVTEIAVAEAFRSALPPGAELAFPSIVISGRRSVFIHGRVSKKRVKRGDVVLFDVGCVLPGDEGGYVSDLSRVAVCGTASPEQKRMHSALVEAIDESLKLYKPGLKTSLAHKRADEVLLSHGYKKIPHSLGHGIGLVVHEDPRISPVRPGADDGDVFEVGNTASVEPGAYDSKLGFGMRIELDILIREDGPEILDRLPWRRLIETDKL